MLLSFTLAAPDTTPPTISNCPGDISQTIPATQTLAVVSWTAPTATDDVSTPDQILRVATHAPNSAFAVGTTTVTYIFSDAAGNDALCMFDIIIQSEFLFFLKIPNVSVFSSSLVLSLQIVSGCV